MLPGVPAERIVQNGAQHVPPERKKIGTILNYPQIVPTEQVLAILAFVGIVYLKSMLQPGQVYSCGLYHFLKLSGSDHPFHTVCSGRLKILLIVIVFNCVVAEILPDMVFFCKNLKIVFSAPAIIFIL